MTGLQKRFETETNCASWVNSDLYPNGIVHAQEYVEWLESQVKKCDLADVGGSTIDVAELIEKLEKASEYWRDYDNSRGYQVGLDKARMIAIEMKNGGAKLM